MRGCRQTYKDKRYIYIAYLSTELNEFLPEIIIFESKKLRLVHYVEDEEDWTKTKIINL